MSNGRRGADAERRARKLLESCGYVVVRSAASKSPIDLVAFNAHGVRLIQVKYRCNLSGIEREALQLMPRAPGTSVECWRYVPRHREPLIELIHHEGSTP
jgi:hypothetical protein